MSMIRCFSVLILLCPQVTHYKIYLRRKPSLIIVTDVNMMLKRAFLQKVTVLLNLTTKKGGFT